MLHNEGTLDGFSCLRLGYPTRSLVTGRGSQLNRNRSLKKSAKINLKAVAEVLQSYDLDPTEEVIKLIQAGKLEPDLCARLYMDLLEYVQPKLARTELTGKDGGALTVEIMRFSDAGKTTG